METNVFFMQAYTDDGLVGPVVVVMDPQDAPHAQWQWRVWQTRPLDDPELAVLLAASATCDATPVAVPRWTADGPTYWVRDSGDLLHYYLLSPWLLQVGGTRALMSAAAVDLAALRMVRDHLDARLR